MRRALMTTVLLALTALASRPLSQQGGVPVQNTGSRRELFVDDALIENLTGGARPRLHRPVPQEVALVAAAPWEG
ncbi:MAG: hypothetical protein KKI08_14425 [Armatimonadetes bacterium]|nr:hypothetical protein [Armatimonadota bacterium]